VDIGSAVALVLGPGVVDPVEETTGGSTRFAEVHPASRANAIRRP